MFTHCSQEIEQGSCKPPGSHFHEVTDVYSFVLRAFLFENTTYRKTYLALGFPRRHLSQLRGLECQIVF